MPATNVFPAAPQAEESDWQERVVAELALEDWVRLEFRDELECVGPIARSIIERHGLLWPFNAHFHWPLLEVARGGSLVTGIGGDELLGTSQWARAAAVLSGSVRPVPRDVLAVGWALSPLPLRRRVLRRRQDWVLRWLTPRANERLLAAWSDDVAREPVRWSRRWSWWRSLRAVDTGFRSLDLLAADNDVRVGHPLADGRFAVSVGRYASLRRIHDRTALMESLFAGLLSPEVQRRSSKATFDEVFWGPESKKLAQVAVDELAELDVVDANLLRAEWARDPADTHSCLLLQALVARTAGAARLDSAELATSVVAGVAQET